MTIVTQGYGAGSSLATQGYGAYAFFEEIDVGELGLLISKDTELYLLVEVNG